MAEDHVKMEEGQEHIWSNCLPIVSRDRFEIIADELDEVMAIEEPEEVVEVLDPSSSFDKILEQVEEFRQIAQQEPSPPTNRDEDVLGELGQWPQVEEEIAIEEPQQIDDVVFRQQFRRWWGLLEYRILMRRRA